MSREIVRCLFVLQECMLGGTPGLLASFAGQGLSLS